MNDAHDAIDPSSLPARRLPLGELLVMAGVLDRATLKEALARQRGRRVRLGTLLVEMGALTETQITQAVAGQLGLHVVDLAQFQAREEALLAVPYTMAKDHAVLPLLIDEANDGGSPLLYAAFSDPTNLRAVNALQIHTGYRVRPVMIDESALTAAIDDYYMALRAKGLGERTASHIIPTLAPVEPPPPAAVVETLDAGFITPLPPSDPSPVIETLDARFITPVEGPPPVDAQAMFFGGGVPAHAAAGSVVDDLSRAPDPFGGLAGPAPVPTTPTIAPIDPFGDALPLAHATPPVASLDADDGEGPEEIDDALVSAIDDDVGPPARADDLFDRSFQGFDQGDDEPSVIAASTTPPVTVDPFFDDPLPSEIVTLAPDQLRTLISAAVERGSLDPSELDEMTRGRGDR